jgi:hypothetical protein
VNRRYIRGLQFSAAYTFGKTLGIADEDEAAISAVRPVHEWNYAPYASNQRHTLVINYTWDLPRASSSGTTRSSAACSTTGSCLARTRS